MVLFPLPHIEDYPRRVRAMFAGVMLLDSRTSKLIWEIPSYPSYLFPQSLLPRSYLGEEQRHAEGATYDIVVGHHVAPEALVTYDAGERRGTFQIVFGAMDSWFEENEEVFVHVKNPYTRIDVLQSSKHVRIEVNGDEVADTRAPRFLYETGLRVRTYIPKLDCRLDRMMPSKLQTRCPYKGVASYYHVEAPPEMWVEDIAWWYPCPSAETLGIKGYVAFFDEKVDVWVDGVKQVQPHTKRS